MRGRGWQVPSYTLPRELHDVTVQRVVVRHGLSKDLACALEPGGPVPNGWPSQRKHATQRPAASAKPL